MRWEATPRHLDPHWKAADPLLYDGFGYELRQIGPDVDARACFLEREIRRHAKLAAKHPEWLEIWGVTVDRHKHLTGTIVGLVSRPFLTDVLESAANHWMPPGWEWKVHDTTRGPVFWVERFDPWAAGERFRVDAVEPLADDLVTVVFRGGHRVCATADDAMLWHRAGEAPADIVRQRIEVMKQGGY